MYKSASYRHTGYSNRDWRQNNGVSRKVTETPKATKTKWGLIIALLITLICIISIIIVILINKPSDNPDEGENECPPGFTEVGCQSVSFIGTSAWSGSKVYKLEDGRFYSYGIGFRVYAPEATSVSILLRISELNEKTFKMIKQEYGYWFYNVGGVGAGCEYIYRISKNEKTSTHLIQNGVQAVIRDDNKWFNVEEDPSVSASQDSLPSAGTPSRSSSYDVIYTIHLPSFSFSGNYSAILPYLGYFRRLGVTTLHLLTLEPHTCEGESTISSYCWCTSLIERLATDRPNVVYPGILHPAYGSLTDLKALIQAILAEGLFVVMDMDLSKFTTHSDWYDYDGSASPYSYGSLFEPVSLYQYDSRMCSKPKLTAGTPTRTIILSMLRRYVRDYKLSGFYWRGLLCLRLDGEECEKGKGSDNLNAISFLKTLKGEQMVLYGEDKKGTIVVENPASYILNIVDPTGNRGLAFDGQLDLSVGHNLLSLVLAKEIDGGKVLEYIQSFADRAHNYIITLATPDEIYENGRLYKQVFDVEKNEVMTIHRLLFLNSLFSLTPGILQYFMGDEYFSENPFYVHPSILDIQMGMTGRRQGLYNFTQSLLHFREEKNLFSPYIPDVYFNKDSKVFAFLLKTAQTRIIGIINCSSEPVKDMEIDFPNIPGSFYEWRYVINTDRSWIYEGIEEHNEKIVLNACVERHFYDTCHNITMGAFAVRVAEVVSIQ